MQKFTFFLKHKSGQPKKVVNVLNRRATLLVTLTNEVSDFKYLKDLCTEDEDFT